MYNTLQCCCDIIHHSTFLLTIHRSIQTGIARINLWEKMVRWSLRTCIVELVQRCSFCFLSPLCSCVSLNQLQTSCWYRSSTGELELWDKDSGRFKVYHVGIYLVIPFIYYHVYVVWDVNEIFVMFAMGSDFFIVST